MPKLLPIDVTTTVTGPAGDDATEKDSFNTALEELSMRPLWAVLADVMTDEPVQPAVPYLWRWRDVEPLITEAGSLVSVEEAERRALMLINPALKHLPAATTALLFAGVQSVLPGEVAPTHRHTPSALRFVISGTGAFAGVAGTGVTVSPGDLLLTPNWDWHDHANHSAEPVIWLDCLDTPLVLALNAVFYQKLGQPTHPTPRSSQDSWVRWGQGIRLLGETHDGNGSPLVAYSWEQSRAALHSLRNEPGSPFDGIIFEYINPATNGAVLPTSSAYLQMLRPQEITREHRHVSSTIYHVAEGRGSTTIDDQPYDWEQGDTFVVPGWSWHSHRSGPTESVLFSFSDRPTLAKLGLERTEERPR